jgi:hypothetical protein
LPCFPINIAGLFRLSIEIAPEDLLRKCIHDVKAMRDMSKRGII